MKPTYTPAIVLTAATKSVPENPTRQELDDPFLSALIKLALVSHRSTSALKTGVHTVNGIVTLTGAVSNQAEKDIVTRLVQDIRGVKASINNMTIEPVSPMVSDR